MPRWKSKKAAPPSKKTTLQPEEEAASEKKPSSESQEVTTIPKAPKLIPKVAVEWAIDPVNDYDWPGAADFAERIGAQIAKENGDSKVIIHANPHNTIFIDGKRVRCPWHITVEFWKALAKMWVNAHVYTNSDGNELDDAALVNPEFFPPKKYPDHKPKNLRGHVKYL